MESTTIFGARITMADKKETVHTIHGYIPKEAWAEFIKHHFVTGKAAEEQIRRARTAGDICGSLGCPSTHPHGGGQLSGCTIKTEKDGSTTIYCHYAAKA
jgi:hypothetical protein